MAKPFNELTEAGKTRRLNKYEAERAERGTVSQLVRMVRPAKFKQNADGSTLAIVRLAHWNKESNKTDFFTATAYIKQGKDALQKFYASLEKGQLVSVEYKSQNGYNNIWNMFDRSEHDKRNKKDDAPAKQEPQPQLSQEADVDTEL